MRVGRKDWPRREPDIPTASFGDLAFLLIIFFILATTLVVTEGFVSESPQGEASHSPQDKANTVTLSAGRLAWNHMPVTLDELRDRLAELDLPRRPACERIVLFEQSGDDRWQAFYEVYAAISAAGGEAVIVLEEGEQQ